MASGLEAHIAAAKVGYLIYSLPGDIQILTSPPQPVRNLLLILIFAKALGVCVHQVRNVSQLDCNTVLWTMITTPSCWSRILYYVDGVILFSSFVHTNLSFVLSISIRGTFAITCDIAMTTRLCVTQPDKRAMRKQDGRFLASHSLIEAPVPKGRRTLGSPGPDITGVCVLPDM